MATSCLTRDRRHEEQLCCPPGNQYLEQHNDKPFALWVSFTEPHSPFDFPIEDRSRFSPDAFQIPTVGAEDAWQVPLVFRDLSDDDKRGIIAAYYTSVSFLDRSMGGCSKNCAS